MTKKEIKEILDKHEIRPDKRLGQSFLIDQNVLDKIVRSADLKKDETVLEVGSGLGNLTKRLSSQVKKVITIEKSKQIFPLLKENLKEFDNIEFIRGDILREELDLPEEYKIVANIPYYLTSPLLRMFLESENQPETMTLLIQKEVAQRITAQPPQMSLLSILIQFYSTPKIISYVSQTCFWPKPKVDSAILHLSQIKKPKEIDIKRFFKLVKAGFSSPRKQLVNNLFSKLDLNKEEMKKALAECDKPQTARAETLSILDWTHLLLFFK